MEKAALVLHLPLFARLKNPTFPAILFISWLRDHRCCMPVTFCSSRPFADSSSNSRGHFQQQFRCCIFLLPLTPYIPRRSSIISRAYSTMRIFFRRTHYFSVNEALVVDTFDNLGCRAAAKRRRKRLKVKMRPRCLHKFSRRRRPTAMHQVFLLHSRNCMSKHFFRVNG